MAASSAIASAYVELLADASHFEPSVREGVANGFSGAESAARDGSDKIASAADGGFKKVKSGAKDAGESVGSELDRGSKKGEASMQKLVESAVWAKATQVIAGFAKGSITAASDVAESTSKIGVLFGESADKITAWADNAASSMGLSKLAAQDAAGTFAVFGGAAGLAGDKLVGFSTDLTSLAVDMASFSNTSPEQAIEAIGAALRGESEPIRAYGVLLDDATLKARAMTLGIFEGTGTLTQQQRVLAAQAEIMAQTGAAQGDFARTADGLANSSKTLKAEFSDLQAEVGTALLPVMQTLVEIAGKAVQFFGALPKPIQGIVVVAALAVAAFAAMSSALQGIGIEAAAANRALGVIGVGLTVAIAVYTVFNQKKRDAIKATDDFITALQAEADGQKNATDAAIAKRIADTAALDIAGQLGFSARDLADIISGKSVPAFDELASHSDDLIGAIVGQDEAANKLGEQYGVSGTQLAEFVLTLNKTREEMSLSKVEADQLATANADLAKTSKGAADAQVDLATRQEEIDNVTGRVTRSQESQNAILEIAAQRSKDHEKALADEKKALEDAETATRNLISATLSSFSAELTLEDQRNATSDAISKYTGLLWQQIAGTYEGDNASRDLADAQRDVYTSALSQAAAAAQLAEDNAKASGSSLTAAESARVQRDSLKEVADSLDPNSPLRAQLEDYIDTLNNKIPKEIQTNLTANVSVRGVGGSGKFFADGDIVDRPTFGVFGERGREAVIPITRPGRAMELMQRSGLGEMWDAHRGGGGGPALVVEGDLVVQDATDADLVAQRVNAGVLARTLS